MAPADEGDFANTQRLEVVVVGAGLAGLVAAYELEQLGHSVVILEADPQHIGGRVRTHRFEDGSLGELGAMRIPKGHDLTRRYIRQFNLSLRPFVITNPDAYYFARGARVRQRQVRQLYPRFRLTPSEATLSPEAMWAQAITRFLEGLSEAEQLELSLPAPVSEAIRRLDQLSLQDLCEQSGLSEEAIELMATTAGYESTMWSAATETLREERSKTWYDDFDELEGGMQQLTAAFAAQLRSKPRMGCEVSRIEQNAGRRRAAALFTHDGVPGRAEGDFVICTAPLPVVARLEFEPPLSPRKQHAVRQVTYDSATKVLTACRRRFWETDDGIFGGGSFTDLPTGSTYYPSDNARARDGVVSAGGGVLLASYTWSSQQARRMGSLSEADRLSLTLANVARLHPQIAEPGMVRESASWSWDRHKWSGGAYSWFSPGQHTRLYRHVVEPEGRIFFAGEHASLSHTWMQGALESGRSAVRSLLKAAL